MMTNNLNAILLVILAMAGFAIADLLIKLAGQAGVSSGMVLLIMGAIGGSIFGGLLWVSGQRLWTRDFLHPVVLIRNLAEIGGGLCMVIGLALVPLSLVGAISQAAPLIVTLGAALALREKVGPRRWIAVIVGLLGVLIIIRPGTDGWVPGAIYTVLAVIGLAIRDLATRRAPPTISNLQLAFFGFGSLAPVGALIVLATGTDPFPSGQPLVWIVFSALFGALAYFAITAGMRMAEASLVAPYRYTRLLFLMGLGYYVLDERPDIWTLIGAGIVIASGLFVFIRERQLTRSRNREAQ